MVSTKSTLQYKPADTRNRQMLTAAERSAFIEAELCLMEAPSKLGIPGAKTRWDDLQYNHIVQTNMVHDVVSNLEAKNELCRLIC
jgi:hypothetical protein